MKNFFYCLFLSLVLLQFVTQSIQSFFVSFIFACIFILLIPGSFFLLLTQKRSEFSIEFLCISFLFSISVIAMLALFLFALNSNINKLVFSLFFVSFFFLVLTEKQKLYLPKKKYDLFVVGAATVGFFLSYRWGESLFDISKEKMLGLMFSQYYLKMNFYLTNIAVWPGFPPKNLLNLWELLCSLVAATSRQELLDIFFKFRSIIPFFGILSLGFMISQFTKRNKEKMFIFACSCFIILFGLFCQNPSSLNWIISGDSTRWVTCFLGSIHHSDAGMDILIPLGLAFTFKAYRKPTFIHCLFLFLFYVVSFLWHPREFFQNSFYLGLLLGNACIHGKNKKLFLLKKTKLLLPTVFAGSLCFAMTSIFVPGMASGYNEFAIKKRNLEILLDYKTWFNFRSIHNSPFHANLVDYDKPQKIFERKEWQENIQNYQKIRPENSKWAFLLSISMCYLIFYGNIREKFLSNCLFFLWFAILCWDVGLQLVSFLTYSEFFMTTPRLYYIFLYLIFPLALRRVFYNCKSKKDIILIIFFAVLFQFWVFLGQPFATFLGYLITLACFYGILSKIVRRQKFASA